jgi:hypothetical protein
MRGTGHASNREQYFASDWKLKLFEGGGGESGSVSLLFTGHHRSSKGVHKNFNLLEGEMHKEGKCL